MSEDVPLPKVNQRYKDDHGALVTVTSVEETRVVFMRDGYPHPCMRPMYNFLGKFKPAPPGRNRIKRNPCRQSHCLMAA